MKLRTKIHRVRLGRDEYRVVTAAPQAGRAVLYDGDWSMQMYLDRQGAQDLAAAWALAARSRRSLVHLPLRAADGPAGLPWDIGPDGRLDLLLVHHSLGLPPSRWKEIRARLGTGTPHTADVPATDFPPEEAIDHDRRNFTGWLDELRFAGAAHTLVVTGSATAFRWTGSWLHSLSREAPAFQHHHGRSPGSHYCITLRHNGNQFSSAAKGIPSMLHITYAHQWKVD
ncbi:hypothetical protein [Kitasatospora sp. NPDC097643]|uniref:hypothetical protein n=1 Tax=Kitasatospora sp. NPDC097643 TaxID=3157230 RepID=UPI00331EA4F4